MPHVGAPIRRVVAARWPLHLIHVLREKAETNRFVTERFDDDARPFDDYRSTIATYPLGRYLAARDGGGDTSATWRRQVDRWLKRRAPEPDLVRRALRALDADWLVGLGKVGYTLHAIALIHAIWKRGHYTAAGGYLQMLFVIGCARTEESNPAILGEASTDLWGDAEVPARVRRPPDLTDELFNIWGLVENAYRTPGPSSVELDLNHSAELRDMLARRWIARYSPALMQELTGGARA